MTTYGLTATGFVIKPLAVIREEIAQAFEDIGGVSVGVRARSDEDPLGHVIGVMAERHSLLWELVELLVSVMDPDSATGARLDAIARITGTIRLPATYSTVTLTLTGVASTVVPAGSQVSVMPTSLGGSFAVNYAAGFVDGASFATDEEAVLVAASAWAQSTSYVVGDRVTNPTGSNDYIWQCSVAGTSLGSGSGPSASGALLVDNAYVQVDNTVTWRLIGKGAAVVDVDGTATETGPITANTGDVRTVVNPVSGWYGVFNVADGDIGTNVETDEALRIRRVLDLARPGTSPVDSLRAALLAVDDVEIVNLFVNNTISTDADGVPPKAVEALVVGGDDQDIWDALLANVAAGILTYGTESGTAVDSEGNDHTMAFSRATEVEIWVIVTLEKDPDTYPSDGDSLVTSAITTWADTLVNGRDVNASQIAAQAFSVDGVLECVSTDVLIGLSDPPSASTTLTITDRQIAVFDSARITINSSDGTF